MHSLTCGVVAGTLPDPTCSRQIHVPAVGLAGGVAQYEGQEGIGPLDGIAAALLAGGQRVLEFVENCRGRELG